MEKILLRNKRNENKYIEVRHYKDSHYAAKQFMMFENGVVNFFGAYTGKRRTGKLVRIKKDFFEQLLEDYTEVSRKAM